VTTKIAAIQMVSTSSLQHNLDSAARLIKLAAEQGAKLVLLPEVFAVLEGGPMAEFAEVEGSGPIQEFLSKQACENRLTVVGGTIPLLTRPGMSEKDEGGVLEDGRVRPACLVYDDQGRQIARYDKIHLFDVAVDDNQSEYSESRSYEAGDEVICIDTDVAKLGLTICYDMRFPELYRKLFNNGAELITVPAAFTRVTGEAHWESILRARAIENQCYILAAGQGGKHSENRETWGHSMIIDPWGSILAQIPEGEGVAIAEIDLEFVRDVRKRMPIAEHIRLQDS
jgi:deaminated glutathione amidase